MVGIDRIAHDHRNHRGGILGQDRFHDQFVRCVERRPYLVVEPGPLIEQVDGAEQIDGRIGVTHHPERRDFWRRGGDAGGRPWQGCCGRPAQARPERPERARLRRPGPPRRDSFLISKFSLSREPSAEWIEEGSERSGLDAPILPVSAIIENLLDPHPEQARQPEGQRQRRIVLAGLDRVDRLARHTDPAAKLRLAPATFCTYYQQSILQCRPQSLSEIGVAKSRWYVNIT